MADGLTPRNAIIRDLNMGGIANSKYQGQPNSVAQMVGLDIHSDPGLIKVNQKLTKESGATVDGLVRKILPCTDGNTYLFSGDSGKIWKRTAGGTYSLAATNAQGGMFDAVEDQGYVYYCSETHIGRWDITGAWIARNDTWQAFTNGSSTAHPIVKNNLVVYIGDDNLVDQIRDGTYTGGALDIKDGLIVKSLGTYDTNLLVGDYVNDNVNKTELFLWNTWSESFSHADPIPEKGINAFLDTDNAVIVNAGYKGNLYAYNGGILQQYKRINGSWGIGEQAFVYSNAVANVGGVPLFAMSNDSGNPCLQGVYSIGRYSNEFPMVLNLEHVISQDKTSNIEIGAMAVVDDVLLVAWKDGANYGVDKLDSTAKYDEAYLESRMMLFDRKNNSTIKEIIVYYKSLPTSTDVEIHTSTNYGAYASQDTVEDTDRDCIRMKYEIPNVYALQVKPVFKVNSNDAPEVEAIEIIWDA